MAHSQWIYAAVLVSLFDGPAGRRTRAPQRYTEFAPSYWHRALQTFLGTPPQDIVNLGGPEGGVNPQLHVCFGCYALNAIVTCPVAGYIHRTCRLAAPSGAPVSCILTELDSDIPPTPSLSGADVMGKLSL